MKYIISLLLTVVGIQIVAGAETKTKTMTTTETKVTIDQEKKPVGIESKLEPYGTVSWTGLDGKAEIGAGVAGVINIYQTGLSLVAFGEGDHEKGLLVERLGGGLRYNAYLGKYLSLDAGVSGGYDLEDPHFFLRLPLGANITFYRSKNVDASIRAQYAFDISSDTPSRSTSKNSGGATELNGYCNPMPEPVAVTSSSNERSAIGRLFVGPVLTVKF